MNTTRLAAGHYDPAYVNKVLIQARRMRNEVIRAFFASLLARLTQRVGHGRDRTPPLAAAGR